MLESQGVQGRGAYKREKHWDNCKSIINEIYLKKKEEVNHNKNQPDEKGQILYDYG